MIGCSHTWREKLRKVWKSGLVPLFGSYTLQQRMLQQRTLQQRMLQQQRVLQQQRMAQKEPKGSGMLLSAIDN
eukprot:5568162-Pyramimonas_sp.AAC.2